MNKKIPKLSFAAGPVPKSKRPDVERPVKIHLPFDKAMSALVRVKPQKKRG